MMGCAKVSVAAALALVAVLSSLAVPTEALDRSDGDYWVYGGSMDFEGISLSGCFRYEFEDKDILTIGSESYDVNLIKITGFMMGESEDFSGLSASVEVLFDGYTYEVDGSLASMKEGMYLWANTTIGTGSLAVVSLTEVQEVTTYSPPMLSGFVEGETGIGDYWAETTVVTSVSTVWVDGVIDQTSADEYSEASSIVVAASEESVTTDAGTFDCLRITVTDADGDYDVYWYSPDVGSWVKSSMYELGDPTPYMSVELTEYSYGHDRILALLPWIVGVAACIAVIVIILLVMRGRGPKPVSAPQRIPMRES